MIATIQHDLGSDSGDETKIAAMVKNGKEAIESTSSSNSHNNTPNEHTMIELFHVRVISNHRKIDALFDSGSQENLISEALVKNLTLKPYHIIKHTFWVG